MPNENPNSANYTTRSQVDFATEMAKFLAKKKGFQLDSKNAYIPRAYLGNIEGIFDALAKGRYQDQSAQGNLNLTEQQIDPSYQAPDISTTLGSAAMKAAGRGLGSMWGGIKKAVSPSAQAPTDDKSLITGSTDPGVTPEPPDLGLGEQGVSPAEVGSQTQADDNKWKTEVKRSENEPLLEGAKTSDKATWDYKQHSNGFGTKARYPGEVVSAKEAHKRFDGEWAKAENAVESFKPNLPFGVKAALTSLTFNSGEAWKTSGLGKAIQDGNFDRAKQLFVQYNRAGGKENSGLVVRREREVKWFDEGKEGAAPMMRLGGPPVPVDTEEASKVLPQGEQVAQNVPGYSTTPTVQPKTGEIQGVPGGYQGAVPPARPLESEAQLRARLRNASPEDQQKILEEYKKNAQGDSYKTQGGGNLMVTPTPGGGQPTATHIPGGDIPITLPGGLQVHIRQKADGTFEVISPNKAGAAGKSGVGPDSAIGELARDAAKTGTRVENIKKIGDTQTETIADAVKSSNISPEAHQALDIIDKTIRTTPHLSFGPQAPYINEAKRVLDNYFPGMSTSISSADSLEKQSILLARDLDKTFSSRGSNFQLETFMQAVPNLRGSKEGALLITNLLKQELKQKEKLGQIANLMGDSDPATWAIVKKNFYDNTPLIINKPVIGKPGDKDYSPAMRVIARDFSSPKEVREFVKKNPQYKGMDIFRNGEYFEAKE